MFTGPLTVTKEYGGRSSSTQRLAQPVRASDHPAATWYRQDLEKVEAELTRYEDDHDPIVGPTKTERGVTFSGPS